MTDFIESLFISFFLVGVEPPIVESGYYDLKLVALSYLVASLASYTALDLAGFISRTESRLQKALWHWGGALAMGLGIWSMHFIGMLAYRMDMAVSYDPLLTMFSGVPAVLVSYFVLYIIKVGKISVLRILSSAILLGAGICAMNYSGMAAMVMDADMRYRPGIFLLSAVIAVAASAAALLIAFMLTYKIKKHLFALKVSAALIMGVAVCGMHYTGMAATVFIPWADCRYDPGQSFLGLALGIAFVTFFILSLALMLKVHMEAREPGQSASGVSYALMTGMVFVVGISVSGLSAHMVSQYGEKKDYESFVGSTEKYTHAFSQRFDMQMARLRSISRFYEAIDKPSKEQIKNFILPLFDTAPELISVHIYAAGAKSGEGAPYKFLQSVYPVGGGGDHELSKHEEIASLLSSDLRAGEVRGVRVSKDSTPVSGQGGIEYGIVFGAGKGDGKADKYVIFLINLEKMKQAAFAGIGEGVEADVFPVSKGLERLSDKGVSDGLQRYAETVRFGQDLFKLSYVRSGGADEQSFSAWESYALLFMGVVLSLIVSVYAFSVLRQKERDRKFKNALEDEKGFLGSILGNLMEGVITIDNAGIVTSFNRWAEHVFGYRAEDVIGKNVSMLMPEPYKSQHDAYIQRYLDTHEARIIDIGREVEGLRKDGSVFPMQLSVSQIVRDGSPVFVGLVSDITDQKAKENALKEAKVAAEAASQAKSDFLANMSHEIRTPMNAILGMSNFLLETRLNSDQRECAVAVKTAGDSLLRIINDIIDISKIEAGKLVLEKAPFDLFDSLQEVISLYSYQAREKSIELIFEIDPDMPTIFVGDSVRIKQIFANLISNALKFTSSGHILIRAGVGEEVKGQKRGGHIRTIFRIEDTGIGIPKDKQDKVFEKFTQAEESTTRKYGGTGLGLAIVTQLVGMMGGKIGLESEEGKGTTFFFDLFLKPDEDGRAVMPLEDLSSLSVLIVDDYKMTRELLRTVMERQKIQCQDVGSAEEALDLLQSGKERFDLCLIDYALGGMNGLRLVEEIRKDKAYENLALIMVSGAIDRKSYDELKACGLDGFFNKPFQPDQIVMAVKLAVEGKRKKANNAQFLTRHNVMSILRPGSKSAEDGAFRQYPDSRVLAVDDVKLNMMVITKVLKKFGVTIDTAENGRDAVEKALAHRYDAVFMDCQMPEMDGFEATKKIRAHEQENGLDAVPIIALTADAMVGDREKCLSFGMSDYINKPFKEIEIATALNRWIGGDGG